MGGPQPPSNRGPGGRGRQGAQRTGASTHRGPLPATTPHLRPPGAVGDSTVPEEPGLTDPPAPPSAALTASAPCTCQAQGPAWTPLMKPQLAEKGGGTPQQPLSALQWGNKGNCMPRTRGHPACLACSFPCLVRLRLCRTACLLRTLQPQSGAGCPGHGCPRLEEEPPHGLPKVAGQAWQELPSRASLN